MDSLPKKIDEYIFCCIPLEAVTDFLIKNRVLLGYVLLIALLAFPYTIFNFSLTLDSEWHAANAGPKDLWVAQGRWGMYLLNKFLLPDSVIPVIPPLIAVIGIAIGAFFFVHSLSVVRGVADYIAAPIAIGCSIFYFVLYFTTLGYGVGVAIAVVNVGLFALTRWTWRSILVSLLSFIFAISIYQAMLPVIPEIFGLYVVSRICGNNCYSLRELARQCMIFSGVLVVSYGLYTVVSEFFLRLMNLSFDEGYIGSYLQFRPTAGYFTHALQHTFEIGKGYYNGGSEIYIDELPALSVMFWLCSVVVLIRIIFSNQQTVLVRLIGAVMLALVMATPLVLLFISDGTMPPRAMIGVAYALAGLVFISLFSQSKVTRCIVSVITIICFYKFIVINARYALVSQVRWQSDRELSTRLIERASLLLDRLPTHKPGELYPVILVGHVDEGRETPFLFIRHRVGESFYSHISDYRMIQIWNIMGNFDFIMASPEQYLARVSQIKRMPDWPAPGSVDVIDGVIVIHLSDFSEGQKTELCARMSTHPAGFCPGDPPPPVNAAVRF